jgi:hypothetical protein
MKKQRLTRQEKVTFLFYSSNILNEILNELISFFKLHVHIIYCIHDGTTQVNRWVQMPLLWH